MLPAAADLGGTPALVERGESELELAGTEIRCSHCAYHKTLTVLLLESRAES